MNDSRFDLQITRNLFSKAQKISLGFLNKKEIKTPFVSLHFRANENKEATRVFNDLVKALKGEPFKLYVNENGGDFLSLSFQWESRGVILTSSPDRYNKRECKDFRLNTFYGDAVKLFFYVETEEQEIIVKVEKNGAEINNLDTIYYEYLP